MLLLIAFILLVGAAAILAATVVRDERPVGLARSLAAIEHFSSVPQEMVQEADPPFADRVLVPFQQRALAVGRRITGADKADRIRHRLDLAGNPRNWSVDRVISLKVMAAVVLPLCGVAYGALADVGFGKITLLALALLVVGFFGPDLYLYNCSLHRSEHIRKSLADAIDLLAISVEAGLGFDAAVQQVGRNTHGPLADEFSRVLREMQLGKGRADALRGLSDRTNVDELKGFVGAMVQADAFGISVGQVLRVQSSEMRLKRRQYAEQQAQKVPVKIMVPLVVCVLPCLFVVIIGPAAFSYMESMG